MNGVLDRWQDHPDVETLWRKITELNPGAPPLLIIEWVLRTRRTCERLRRVVEESPMVLAKVRAVAEKDWRSDRIEEAAWKRRAAKDFTERSDRVLGRKKAAAPRQHFMRQASEMFMMNCGQPLDDVVAALTEIAFGGTVPASVVRDARRAPTRKRGIRPPK